MKFDQEKLAEVIEETSKRLAQECVGVVALGSTGTGKSTLVNTFFPDAKAETGFGAPITQDAKWFPEERKKGQILRILDTKGLEEKAYQQTVDAAVAAVRNSNSSKDENDHAHVAWLLIKEGSARVQESHIEVVKQFTELGIPVIAVITRAIERNEEFHAKVRELLPEVKDVVLVNSVPCEIAGTGHTVPVFGMPELYYATSRAMPEDEKSRNALQRSADQTIVPLDDKRDLALKRVKLASAAAATAGATPIPISDAGILMTIQAGMIVSISNAYGMKVDKGSSMALLATVAAPVAATAFGTALVGSLFKFFPGLGTLAGAAITGTVAASITLAIGHLYTQFLHHLCEENGNIPPQTSQITEEFAEFYKEHGSELKETLKLLKK